MTPWSVRVVAATAVVLLLAGCDGSSDEPGAKPTPSGSTTSGSTTSEPADPGPVVECPAETQQVDPSLPNVVPEGATSVRLCDGGADRVPPPVDALTTDVATVVDAVNAQPLVTRRCADLQTPTYQLAFGYPDGSRFVVAGRFTRCAELLVGSARRAKAKPPLDQFVVALRTQRVEATAPEEPADADAIGCEQPEQQWTSQLSRPTDMTVAVLCYGEPEHPEEARRLTIPADDLLILTRSMGEETSDTAGYLGCTEPLSRNEPWIVGATAWGDPVTMTRGCYALTVAPHEEWTPRRQARAIFKELVAQVR